MKRIAPVGARYSFGSRYDKHRAPNGAEPKLPTVAAPSPAASRSLLAHPLENCFGLSGLNMRVFGHGFSQAFRDRRAPFRLRLFPAIEVDQRVTGGLVIDFVKRLQTQQTRFGFAGAAENHRPRVRS